MPKPRREHKHTGPRAEISAKIATGASQQTLATGVALRHLSLPRSDGDHLVQTHDQAEFRRALQKYRDPQTESEVDTFMEFLRTRPRGFDRADQSGHFTGSAWLVSADGLRTLLTHHRKLDRWLQPGGHADGDADLARVALREAEEESGLHDLVVESAIFDLDRHAIPARGDEFGHWHYDVRFVVRATGSEAFVVGEESHALAWRDIRALAADAGADESLRRMARKWLGRCGD